VNGRWRRATAAAAGPCSTSAAAKTSNPLARPVRSASPDPVATASTASRLAAPARLPLAEIELLAASTVQRAAALPSLPLALAALSFSSFGQTQAFDTQLTRDGVTLNYQDARGALAAPQRKRVIDTFFFAYLRERADFHPPAPAMVRIVIDPAYTGIAFVGDKDQAAHDHHQPGLAGAAPERHRPGHP
jgi:hypothetical protein